MTFVALVWQLVLGIFAIQSTGCRVRPAQAVSWAVAAAVSAQARKLDPFELIGIARNETDFRPWLIGPDGKDCGITQTRTVYSRYGCGQLRSSAWLSFAEAARELAENQARCERGEDDPVRCRLNSYNGGVRYARSGHHGRYFLRVTCFAEAARAGVTPRGDCRKVRSMSDVERLTRRSLASR